MAKKISPKPKKEENLHVKVESWQWERSSPHVTCKDWLAFAILMGVAVLFTFGFLIIAGFILIIVILINIILFLFKKFII